MKNKSFRICSKLCLKAFVIYLWIFSLGLSASDSSAQNINEVIVSLNLKDATVENILQSIEQKTPFTFAYQQNLIAGISKRITIVVNKETVASVLNRISNITILSFKQINENTIVVNRIKKSFIGNTNTKTAIQSAIQGMVTDENGEPLPGASIVEKGTTNGTQTDFDGNFTLEVTDENAVLVVSYVGFLTKEITVGEQESITVTLEEVSAKLEEVVVVGYGTQLRSSVTGSISTIKKESIEQQITISFDDAIAGQLAGVNITQNSGAPGTTSEINIRGIGTLTSGKNPLLVIDGFPSSESTDLSSVNPNNIESIEILKDASASSIYGSRGSNGVILITTKSGSKTKTEFFFNTYYGFQQVTKKVDLTNAYEFAQLTANARNNSWMAINPSNSANDPNSIRTSSLRIPYRLFPYLEGEQGLVDTDWQDEIFIRAPITKYELVASGGSEALTYFIGGEHQSVDGIVINSDYKRYTLTANFKAQLSDKLKIGLNLIPSITNSNELNEGDHKKNGIVFTAIISNPTYAPRDENGDLIISEMISDGRDIGFAPTENPVALAKLTSAKKKVTQLLGSVYLIWKPIEKLQFKSQLGGQTINSREDVFRPSNLGSYAVAAPTQAYGASETDDIINLSIENTVTYNKTFIEKHNMEFLLGQSFQKERMEGNNVMANNFPNNKVTTLNAGTVFFGSSYREEWSLASFFSRINYNYNEKYLLSLALRTDGSSRFGEKSRWGIFPSISAGWNIANEYFFQSKFINALKLIIGYGVTGNNQIGNYASVALLNEANYFFDDSLTNGLAVVTSPNNNLSWERTKMLNIGLDLAFNSGQYLLTAEYYNSNTEDILLDVPVPAHTGFDTSLQNLGKVKNMGFEFSATARINIGKLKWKPSVNFSINKNEVIELGPKQKKILHTAHITEIGKPIGSFYGYNVLGMYKNEIDLLNSASLPTSRVGSYKYEDINNDGFIRDDDKKILGNFFPDYTFGITSRFEFMGIDINIVAQGKQGQEIFYGLGFFNYSQGGYSNVAKSVVNNAFVANKPNATFEQPLVKPTDKNYEFSSLMIQDGSYVRIKNISLGYALPKQVSKNLKVKYARFYITGQNLFTFTNYTGFNPDVSSRNKSWNKKTLTRGVDYGAYPLAKSIVLGLQMKF